MKHALFIAPFGELSDPRRVVEVAVAAEAHGWDGLFLWDHLLRPPDEVEAVGDTWTTLAAVASSTSELVIGPMVTPPNRRRPQVLARQAVAVDLLSDGRLIMGCGLGVDRGGELSSFGEVTELPIMAQRLDEGLDVITHLWTGETVNVRGEHFVAEDVRFVPMPVQSPRIPIWLAARGEAKAPLRRAARFDGLFPVDMDLDRLRQSISYIAEQRGGLDGFDVAVRSLPNGELAGASIAELTSVGVTWILESLLADASLDSALALANSAPPTDRTHL